MSDFYQLYRRIQVSYFGLILNSALSNLEYLIAEPSWQFVFRNVVGRHTLIRYHQAINYSLLQNLRVGGFTDPPYLSRY